MKNAESFNVGNAVPGVLVTDPESSRSLLRDNNGKTYAAIGICTEGRVLAFAHGSFLKPQLPQKEAGAKALLGNGIRWAAKAGNPSVGLSPEVANLEPLLSGLGMRVRVLNPGDLRGQVDAYCFLGQQEMAADEIEAIQKFLHKGGGVIVAATPWPFGDRWPQFSEFPANQVASLAGISFQSNGTARIQGKVSTELPDPSVPLNAAKALGEKAWSNPAELKDLITKLESGANLTDEDLVAFNQALAELDNAIGPVIPSPDNPITPETDLLETAILNLRSAMNQSLPADQILPIAAAEDYPGAIPGNAKRVERILTLNADYKGWLSGRNAGGWAAKELRPTGLYAAPGEVVKVTVMEPMIDSGFEVVIGAYGGGLDNRAKWIRYPSLRNAFPIREQITEAANGLGGLINIRVPRGAQHGDLKIKIEGAVEAPLYVHGVTSLQEWNSRIKKHPAPWAELASDHFIIAIPSSYIRSLSNPDEVMELWDRIIDKAAELAVVNRDDYRAERIVFERQISAGGMHSGYPVAVPQNQNAEQAIAPRALAKEGNWGFFHEYGHNHQHNLWALPGTGETTCNLWSVYLSEELIGKDRGEAHRALNPLTRRQRMKQYFANGRNFEADWSVWTALETYLQLQETFGWEPFQKVFDEYNKLPQEEWPKGQQEINDQWVIRFSKATGKNLEPFFAAWNLPMSDSVAKELQGLPAWEDHPVAGEVK